MSSELRLWGWLLDVDLNVYLGREIQEDSQCQPWVSTHAHLHLITQRCIKTWTYYST